MIKRTSFFVLVLDGLRGLHRNHSTCFFGISGWSIDLDYCDTEWFALEMNEQRLYPSTAFQTLLFDYDGYSISSKGYLSTVVDILVI